MLYAGLSEDRAHRPKVAEGLGLPHHHVCETLCVSMWLRHAVGNVLARWPAWQDFASLRSGRPFAELGMTDTALSGFTRTLRPRVRDADTVVSSVCPYCAVGCGQLIYAKQGKIIDIEGNPASPISGGTLCPKGSATYGLIVNPARVTKVKYRPPYSDRWEERPLDWAMERIAQLVKITRDKGYEVQDSAGRTVNRCINIASLGGATLDNEENYLIKKLFGGGLGMVWIENQARI
jgi:formate dehydrogenase major subunit